VKFFIASHNRDYARLVKLELERLGHECTSRWITSDTKFGTGEYNDEERQKLALMDEEDVRHATDGLILLAEAVGHLVPGGKHVETGMALAHQYPVYVVGRRENIFHWHPAVRVFLDTNELLNYIQKQSEALAKEHSSTSIKGPRRVGSS
jgi:hypothetical protein